MSRAFSSKIIGQKQRNVLQRISKSRLRDLQFPEKTRGFTQRFVSVETSSRVKFNYKQLKHRNRLDDKLLKIFDVVGLTLDCFHLTSYVSNVVFWFRGYNILCVVYVFLNPPCRPEYSVHKSRDYRSQRKHVRLLNVSSRLTHLQE